MRRSDANSMGRGGRAASTHTQPLGRGPQRPCRRPGPWYVPPAVRRREGILAWGPALLAAAVLGGCGGGGSDAPGEKGTFTVSVPVASFPARQDVSHTAVMRIDVRNDGSSDIGNLAVTIEAKGQGTSAPAFQRVDLQKGLAEHFHPVWIIDRDPAIGRTAYSNTWALGRVPAGGVKSFVWRVTPVIPGRHVVTYRVAPGLGNQGAARLAGGGPAQGSFAVDVSGAAPKQIVNPETGRVEPAPPGG